MKYKTFKPENIKVGDTINTKRGKLVIGEILYYLDYNNVWNKNIFEFNGTIYGKTKKDNFFYSIKIYESENLNKNWSID
tara:strand:- start:43 stop:279 length:237 start_codon:yes stop_codon:yes gene_type:complete